MNYREMQAECKKRGISAQGNKATLEKRLSGLSRSFVFSGDPRSNFTGPGWIFVHGYQFHLKGKPVVVDDVAAAKLATHTHFTEA